MMLYSSIGPNPRTVRMFAAEKGIALDIQDVDIMSGDNRQDWYYGINPLGTTPTLILSDGTTITETLAACEYLEEMQPAPALIGETPEQRALVRSWTRRIDLGFVTPLTLGFRAAEGRAMFAPRMRVAQEAAAPDLKAMAFDMADLIERQCVERAYVTGDDFTLADLLLFCFVDFGRVVGIDLLAERPWLTAWFARVGERPSTAA
jgi:glutathione S-transferase